MSCFSTGRKKRRPSRTAKQNKASPGPAWVPELFCARGQRRLVGGGVLDAPWAAAIFWVLRRPQTPCRGGACPSRRNDCDSYRASTKRCAPIASVRFYQQPVRTATAFPRLYPKGTSSRFALRAPRRVAPRNDTSGSMALRTVLPIELAVLLPLRGRLRLSSPLHPAAYRAMPPGHLPGGCL